MMRAIPALALFCLATAWCAGPAAAEPATAAGSGPVILETGSDGVQRATVEIRGYSFAPANLVAKAGMPVRLTLQNHSDLVPHNFTIDDPAAGFAVSHEIPAGKTAVVSFTPVKAGTFAFYCNKKLLFLPSHRKKGMEGTLQVVPAD